MKLVLFYKTITAFLVEVQDIIYEEVVYYTRKQTTCGSSLKNIGGRPLSFLLKTTQSTFPQVGEFETQSGCCQHVRSRRSLGLWVTFLFGIGLLSAIIIFGNIPYYWIPINYFILSLLSITSLKTLVQLSRFKSTVSCAKKSSILCANFLSISAKYFLER